MAKKEKRRFFSRRSGYAFYHSRIRRSNVAPLLCPVRNWLRLRVYRPGISGQAFEWPKTAMLTRDIALIR